MSNQSKMRGLSLAVVVGACGWWVGGASGQVTFPTSVPVPPENPITEQKRILGKMLFWDEQLSATNTVACGTCHRPRNGGSDPRLGAHPGFDGISGTIDDVFGSAGTVHSDAVMNFVRDLRFDMVPQVTGRAANTTINAAFAPELFWDGRARSEFRDPLTGEVLIASGGALESQAVGPPVNGVEMAHDAANWTEITAKIATVQPMALATSLPPDIAAVLEPGVTYRELFSQAFGHHEITPARIAFAIATYERTLIANDTPWDRAQQGVPGALTAQQQFGAEQFDSRRCAACHVPPLFTDNSFRNIGVRPPDEDLGRQNISGDPLDRGKFKVPTVRNAALKSSFMHHGKFTTLTEVLRFYGRAPGAPPQFEDNIDPLMHVVTLPLPSLIAVEDFIRVGLTDVRVRDGLFPFDRPTLTSEISARQPTVLAGGVAGTGGVTPRAMADMPGMMGAPIRIGLSNALAGTDAILALSLTAPTGGQIVPTEFLGEYTVSTDGMATHHLTIDPHKWNDGQVLYFQWFVNDPSAPGSTAKSSVARVPVFCSGFGCPQVCTADFNNNFVVDTNDFFAFLDAFFSADPAADINDDNEVNSADFFVYLEAFFGGC